MKKIITVLVLSILFTNLFSQETTKYSKEQVKNDFKFLYTTLQATHYNLYINTSKNVYDQKYLDILNSINDSLALNEIYRIFQPFVALSGLGHCHLDFPFQKIYVPFIQNGGVIFPLNVKIENNKMFVKTNYTKNNSIKKGYEILSINNKSSKNILHDIFSYLSGESNYLKNTLLDMLTFPRMMWLLEEPINIYNLKIKDDKGVIRDVSIKSITAAEYESKCSGDKQIFDTERTFKFIDNIAYVKPGPFMNAKGTGNTSDINTFDKGEFLQYVDSAFKEISKRKSDHLILDLRNNSGGANSFSDEIISYFADKPFRFCSKFVVKTSKITKLFWQQEKEPATATLKEQILSHNDGEIFESEIQYNEPKIDSLKFKGDVYVLINRFSYSQASVTAAMIQDYKFGTIVGEETADPAMYGSVHQFNLPNTKIEVTYPKAFIVRPNGDSSLKGTVPDHIVKTNIFSDKDEILDYTINLIKNKN